MTPILALALLGLSALAGSSTPSLAPRADEAGVLREEHFALTQGGRPVGLACYRRLDAEAGVQLELELEFPEHDLRVREVLRRAHGRATYVWREIRPRAGRTVLGRVDGRSDPRAVDLREWGGQEALNARLTAGTPVLLLPDLIERARSGRPGPVEWLDPLARCLARGRLTGPVQVDPDARADGHRTAGPRDEEPSIWQLRRSDGGLEWTLAFRGEVLESIAWGEAGPRATAVSGDEYELRKALSAQTAAATGTDDGPGGRKATSEGEIAARAGPRAPRARTPE